MIPNKPEHQAKIDRLRGLVHKTDEWIGMYIVARDRADDAEKRLNIAMRALAKIADWYSDSDVSDFSGDTPTSYAADTLDVIRESF